MANRQDQKEAGLARMLRYVLGVHPDEFGLLPDKEGWVPLKELIKAFSQEDGFKHVRASMVEDIANRVAPDQVESDGKNVRAREREPLPMEWTAPPGELYLAVKTKAWPSIKDRGMNPPEGSPVMLATEKDLAMKLGKRRDSEPALVAVAAGLAAEQGVVFRKYGEKLWLAGWLPAACLNGPRIKEQPTAKQASAQKAKPKPAQAVDRMPEPEAMPGGFYPTADEIEKPYKRKGISKDIAWKKDRKKGMRRKKTQ